MHNKINSLESLRGVAAVCVALYHYPSKSFLYLENGNLAVYFFFALSGFVISLNYFDKIKNIKNLINFQIKRFFRLYPVHLFLLLLILSIQVLKFFVINYLNLDSANYAFTPYKIYSFEEFIRHIFLLQSVLNNGYYLSWNSVAWTISTEFYTYLLFGFLVLVLNNNKIFYIIVSLIFLLTFKFSLPFFNKFFHVTFLDCIKFFLTGSITYFVYSKIKFRINDLTFVLFLIIILTLKFKLLILENNVLFSFAILLVSILSKSSLFYKTLNFKLLVFLGTISYSFYMIHQVVLYMYVQLLKFVFKVNFQYIDGVATNTNNFLYDTFITLSYVIFSIFASYLMYKKIELPFRRKK